MEGNVMGQFELLFRGAVHKFLKRNGHDVDKVVGVVPDTERTEIVILYSPPKGPVKHHVFHGSVDEFIREL